MDIDAQPEGNMRDDRPILAAALWALNAERFAEAASLLRPLAETGHLVAQMHLAELYVYGWHRFATRAEMDAWCATATDEETARFAREEAANVELATGWLQNASNQGLAAASHNLGMAYLIGAGDLSADQRRAKGKEFLDKSCAQGFAFFGGPDGNETYLRMLDGFAASAGIRKPWDRE